MATQQARIEITASDKTRAAFDSAQRGLQGMQATASRLNGLLAGLGVGLAGGGLVTFAKRAIDAADNLNDLSQKIGVSVENLAGFRLAAEQSGTSLEAIGTASRLLAQNIAQGDKTLKALGITSTDVNGALGQLADLFARMPDGAQKTAIAMQLMGRSGADMIPLLNGGGEALRGMIAEGQRLYPITTEMARAADQFNDSLAKIKVSAEGLGVRIGNALLPSLNNLIREAEEGTRVFGGFWRAFVGVGVLTDPFKSAGENLKEVRRQIEEIESGKIKMGDGGERLRFLRQQETYLKSQRAIDLGLPTKTELRAEAERQRREVDAALKGGPVGLPDVTVRAKRDKADKLDIIDPFGSQRRAAEADALRKQVDAQNEAFDRLESMRDEQIRQDETAAAALGRLRDQYRDMIDPLQKYREQLEEVRILADAGLIDPDQAMEAEFAIQQQIDAVAGLGKELDKTKDFAEDFGLTFNSALEDALVNGKRFSDVLKSLEQDIARIIIRKSVTEPLGNAISSIFKGIDFGKIFGFGGGRAGGGAVYPGQYYVVGERGPEVLLPNTAGTVVPNSALGGGVQIVQNISIDSRSDRASILAAMSAAKDAAKAEILASMQRGGTFARATGRA